MASTAFCESVPEKGGSGLGPAGEPEGVGDTVLDAVPLGDTVPEMLSLGDPAPEMLPLGVPAPQMLGVPEPESVADGVPDVEMEHVAVLVSEPVAVDEGVTETMAALGTHQE
jgi:hypothetical protein